MSEQNDEALNFKITSALEINMYTQLHGNYSSFHRQELLYLLLIFCSRGVSTYRIRFIPRYYFPFVGRTWVGTYFLSVQSTRTIKWLSASLQ